MKISIGTNIKEGPWGGGNLFAINLKNHLISKGHSVVTDLNDDDIDIILITEPRKTSESSAFTHLDVNHYLNYANPNAMVVHRINECDERKNTNFVNKYLIEANKVADYTVFVSVWLKELYLQQGINTKNNYVIMAGANPQIFNNSNKAKWDSGSKLKIVTHHWGANWNKGFDVYEKIDNLIDDNFWNKRIEFMYIGNLPNKFKFKNSKHIKPLSGKSLSSKLKENNLYITGSLNEPSGNHHIEASQCGIPLMYIDSGGVKEYCEGFGIEYTQENLEEKLKYAINNYKSYFKKIESYPFNSDLMCDQFLNLFDEMLDNKEAIMKLRNITPPSFLGEKIYKYKRRINLDI